MTAYEQSMADLVRRVEELELEVNGACGSGTKFDYLQSLQARVERMDSEIEALEKRRSFQEKTASDVEEYVRRDRWHATYNAVRGGMEAATSDLCPVDDAHEYAAEAADCAHGPLEVKP